MNSFLKVVGSVALILVLLWLLVPAPEVQERMTDMPWQIETFEDGSSKVLGIHLGQDRLQDVVRLLGRPEGLALFSPTQEGNELSLEAYFGTVRNGPLAAKLVVVLEADGAEMRAMAGRAVTRKPGASGAYQWTLAEEDKLKVQERKAVALTYIPLYSKLDGEFFSTRFGEPASRSQVSDQVERWFYPQKGLSIVIDNESKEVLHYTMPRDFSVKRMDPPQPQPKP
jgi:hypothetical protein